MRLSGEVEEQSKALQASHEQAAQLESEINRRNQELQAAKQQVKAEGAHGVFQGWLST